MHQQFLVTATYLRNVSLLLIQKLLSQHQHENFFPLLIVSYHHKIWLCRFFNCKEVHKILKDILVYKGGFYLTLRFSKHAKNYDNLLLK